MANEKNIRQRTINGFLWRFLERCGAQIVSFVVSIVLARLLEPEAYGSIALILVFTNILQVFVDSGMGNALIQKKDADHLDFSTVFFFNLFLCILLYLMLYISAPFIGIFYDRMDLVPAIRAVGLTLIISGVKNVQQAYVSRYLLFKKFFFATLGGTLGAAVLGITFAYLGFGIWALVIQHLFNATVDTIILWVTVKWRPQLEFSFERLKGLFSYGWKLLVSSIMNTIYNDLRSLIIGKKYSSSDLAFYNKGQSFPTLVVNNINTSIDSVLLPVMSSKQDDRKTVKSMAKRSITVSSFLMWPLMIGLAVIAKPLVTILLTEKWLNTVPFLQIACISFGFEPIQTANLNAIKAVGRSDIFLRLEIIKKTIAIVILLVAMRFGVLAIAISSVVYCVIATFINAFPNRKLLKYGYKEQFKDVFTPICLSLIMGACIYPIQFLHIPSLLQMILQIIGGGFIYYCLSTALKYEPLNYILSTIKRLADERKKS